MATFVRTYRSQGGRLAISDVSYLAAGTIMLMGFILSAGGMARFAAHYVRGDQEGLQEERMFVANIAAMFAVLIVFLALNAGLNRSGL